MTPSNSPPPGASFIPHIRSSGVYVVTARGATRSAATVTVVLGSGVRV